MALLDDIFQRGYREAQEECAQHLALLIRYEGLDPSGDEVEREHPLTEEVIEQAADPDEDGGWGGWLTDDDYSREALGCDPFTEEWNERNRAYVRGAEQGADDWVQAQLNEMEAREVEAAVRTEWPETLLMPREIMADWLEDRDDSRAATLRTAMNGILP